MDEGDFYPKRMYVDESGDISKKGTKHLVLTSVCIDSNKDVYRIIKKIKKKLSQISVGRNWLKKNNGEVKFANFPNYELKKELFGDISLLDMDITCLVIEKNECDIFYEEKRDILFMMLENHVKNKHRFPFKAILDNDFLGLKKDGYLFLRQYLDFLMDGSTTTTSQVVFSEFVKGIPNFVRLEERDSKSNYGIQLADLICGSIFRKYEFNDSTFLDILEKNNKINFKIKKVLQNPPTCQSHPYKNR